MKQIYVAGNGLAALACHALFRRFGLQSFGDAESGSLTQHAVPFVVVNSAAWRVITDVFRKPPAWAYTTARRLVVHHWSPEVFTRAEAHYVLPADIIRALGCSRFDRGTADEVRSVETRAEHRMSGWIESGRRTAWICEARSCSQEAASSLLFEFVPDGWVFWAPTGERTGFLQFVLPDAQAGQDTCLELLRSTRLARKWIVPQEEWRLRAMPSAARANRLVADSETIFCGSAAMQFDPISGDGTGASLRSAILACAALRYAVGHPAESRHVFGYYASRMSAAFQDHLRACNQYYGEAQLSASWEPEITAMKTAALCAGECLPGKLSPRYRLEDLSLRTI